MRAAPFNLQVEGTAAAEKTAALWRSTLTGGGGCGGGGGGKREGNEPRSVLDKRRSPSPPTSTSTLCSSQGGGSGGGSTDSAGVAAVSDNPLHPWPPSQDSPVSAPADAGAAIGEGRREDWASELQPIPAGLDLGLLGADKCGLGMEDWDSMMLPDTGGPSASSPAHDQTFLKWIMGEVEDTTSAAAWRQQGGHPTASMEFDAPSSLLDPVYGFEHLGGMGMSLAASPLCSSSTSSQVAPVGGFAVLSTNNGGTHEESRVLPISPNPGHLQGSKGSIFSSNSSPSSLLGCNVQLPLPLPTSMLFQDPLVDEKPHLLGPGSFSQLQAHPSSQNPGFFLPMAAYAQREHQQQYHHHHLPSPQLTMAEPSCQVSPAAPDPFLRRLQQQQQPRSDSLHPFPYHGLQQVTAKPKLTSDEAAAAQQLQQQQQLVDQLFKAAELIEAGNFVNARGILARLNHQLSPIGKPLLRSAFYCKEALQCIVADASGGIIASASPPLQRNPSSATLLTPFDVVLKLSAYKAFSEVSPILQFANFTCTQSLLEELNGCDRIHIIDFDIGVGGQWSSFMQELAQRRSAATPSAVTPALKITAFASLCSNHPLELGLTRENLSHFANDLNIPFEINILNIDSFEPTSLLGIVQRDEAIAVNLPVGLAYPSVLALLRLVKQLGPKIVVSVDHGAECSELAFSRYFLHSLQSAAILLDSIDAAGTNRDVVNKIERYLLQPRIENAFLERRRAADKVIPWRALFASAGFLPLPFSNFTETQAECLLKRFHVRGFHVDKRQQSLILCWQQGELVSVSSWRC